MLPSFGTNAWNHQIVHIFENSGGLLLLKNIYQYKVATNISLREAPHIKK